MINQLVQKSNERYKKANVGLAHTKIIVPTIAENVYTMFILLKRHLPHENIIAEKCVTTMCVNILTDTCPNFTTLFTT